MAAKGGFNNESHNHNDVGTFSLYVNTIPVILDAGVGTYAKQTFGKDRYTIWTMQSNYHNLPMINGITAEIRDRNTKRQIPFAMKRNACSLLILLPPIRRKQK